MLFVYWPRNAAKHVESKKEELECVYNKMEEILKLFYEKIPILLVDNQ